MTNQDYMDLLKRFACGESTTEMKIEYYGNNNPRELILRYFVNTNVFDYSNNNVHDPAPIGCNVIEIMENELIMLMPNIMDAYIAQTHTSREIRDLSRLNAILQGAGNKIPNQHSSSQVRIPYYKDEAERFQRELMGEFVLYESHLQYVHKIAQDAHDAYETKMRETWDKAVIL